MEGKRFLQKIKLQNLLSFGSEGVELELQPLNVLIGPNGSGKSNLIEAISVLRALPRDLQVPFRGGGGVDEWSWKGEVGGVISRIKVLLPFASQGEVSYLLDFVARRGRALVMAEELRTSSETLYSLDPAPMIAVRTEDGSRKLREDSDIFLDQSVLSQRRDSTAYPELTQISREFELISLFGSWDTNRRGPLRQPQRADLPDDFLLEDASNLGLILNDLQNRRVVWKQLLDRLRLLYEGIEDVTLKVQGGTVQIFFHEQGLSEPVPAARLSDGTLRYLCLLAILLHPAPPPLICLEEPELGLHPDAVRAVGDLLIEASQRTQLIVTTHSTSLVSALTEVPEAVVVCERGLDGTTLRRLEPEKLEEWLEHYSLGDLWSMGQLGGTR